MSGDQGDGRRIPTNLQGLFKFCAEQTVSEDAPSESRFEPMTDERKAFLEEVFRGLQGSDPIKKMAEDLKLLSTNASTDDDLAEKETALESLQNFCEDMDHANDLVKIGGLSVCMKLLHSEAASIRWGTAELLSVMVQNNPYSQEQVLSELFLPVLLSLLDTDTNDTTRTKALYAISSLTRDSRSAQDQFLAGDGFSVLMRAMQSAASRLQTKAAFMLSWLCIERPEQRDTLCNMGMVEQLVGLLSSEHRAFHEHLMSALLNLSQGHSHALSECRRPELGLRQLLTDRMQLLKDQEENMEEYNYCDELYKLCFQSDSSAGVER